jgi:hypothetical protein
MVRGGNTRPIMLKRMNIHISVAEAASAAMAKPCRQDLVPNEGRFGTLPTLAARRMR